MRLLVRLPILAVLLLWARTPAEARTEWKHDSALVFLHRSAGMVAPENSEPAFDLAVRQGADGIETDVRRTSDGVFVIYHDDWVLRQRGPSGKIERMTFAETQRLDIGERFGPPWRRTRIPLFEDLLRFAVANRLLLYLDIKTPGIYEDVMRFVADHGAMDVVYTTGGQVPPTHYSRALPWIGGWNYTDGGEEDPEKMETVLATAPKLPFGVMCDDARTIVRALGRRPENRPLVPFRSTAPRRLRAHSSPDSEADRRSLDTLLRQASSDPAYTARQDACWSIGARHDDRAVEALVAIAQTRYDPKTAAQTDYRDTFLKIAGACALARIGTPASAAGLHRLLDSTAEFDRAAAATALAAFGTARDIPDLKSLVDGRQSNDGFTAQFVIGYVGRFGAKAIPIYVTGFARDDIAKQCVFGLAALGSPARREMDRLLSDASTSPKVRRRAKLVLRWLNSTPHALSEDSSTR